MNIPSGDIRTTLGTLYWKRPFRTPTSVEGGEWRGFGVVALASVDDFHGHIEKHVSISVGTDRLPSEEQIDAVARAFGVPEADRRSGIVKGYVVHIVSKLTASIIDAVKPRS